MKKTSAIFRIAMVGLCGVISALSTNGQDDPNPAARSDAQLKQVSPSAVQWTFESNNPEDQPLVETKRVGSPVLVAGPRAPDYPGFAATNQALKLDGASYIRFADPGADSDLDFGNGDAITLEAWVRTNPILEGQQVYLIGKGRTGREGFAVDNQNWALRLRSQGGTARVSFLFRGQASANQPATFHRWNSNLGILPDERWHHVAVRFRFGEPESIAAFIDGEPVGGDWDMGDDHSVPPVQDDDEVWLGSSLGGSPNSSFVGELDNVSIHRGLVSDDELRTRFKTTLPVERLSELSDDELGQRVVVEVLEGIGSDREWKIGTPRLTDRFEVSQFALSEVPPKYNHRGLRVDRTNPFLVRLRGRAELPGTGTLLIRTKNAARVWIDGELVAWAPFMKRNSSGHEPVPDLAPPRIPGMHPLPSGHQEATCDLSEIGPGRHLIRVETIVGGNGLRAELGDLCLAIQKDDGHFEVWAPEADDRFALSSAEWLRFELTSLAMLRELGQQTRRGKDVLERRYWDRRHKLAKLVMSQLSPLEPPMDPAYPHPIDAWIGVGLKSQGLTPTDPIDELSFLRRVYLDTVGVPPTVSEIKEYLADEEPNRRLRWIDRLLEDPRWADHWVSYWQDVLAENPGILKPELNNTGPFRYWIYESFLDNKPIDRFATELVRMEGSRYGGGPAGFAMASQNDVPMAAKGIVLGSAFLGIDMTCARCHDAPDRESTQLDLFSIAALLQRRPIQLPKTSSVPPQPDGRQPAVTVSLTPGQSIVPEWPYAESDWAVGERIPIDSLLRSPNDPRERLAALITSPENQRFPRVIANRLWARWLGRGLMDPVDDWELGSTRHPELLDWLGRELVAHDYDLKHLARLILSSETYQRAATGDAKSQRWFAGPSTRRLTAEQFVDSLFAISGKSMGSELLTLDPEGRRPANTFLNMGVPMRAWNYVSLSNERDRPALALPVAQGVVDLLIAFGWRDSRSHPKSTRDHDAQVLQPLVVANGDATHRLTQLSDDSWFTHWSLVAETPDQWIRGVFLRILGRNPTAAEQSDFIPLIAEDFAARRVEGAQPHPVESQFRNAVSWSNHLHPDATSIKLRLEAEARRGDKPTALLTNEWRQRAEDVVWVIMNSPELLYMP